MQAFVLVCVLPAAIAHATEPAAPVAVGPRLTMEELHRQGGVPKGWQFTPFAGDAAAGRNAFVELGCDSCHVVRDVGLSETKPTGPGPELTGMGTHHPQGYFAESILNPDAVQVDGPGYLDEVGRSRMPTYPDMTAKQLQDLVAFLGSLRSGGGGCHEGDSPPAPRPALPASAAAPDGARAFLARTYVVPPGQLGEVESWFEGEAAVRLKRIDGVLAIETFADRMRDDGALTTVISFRDRTALDRFFDDEVARAVIVRFDAMTEMQRSAVYDAPPLYRAPSLSTQHADETSLTSR